uniref:NADH-ubiquinone oxidoreductase chain 5 n=1 Tax=Euciroa cf. queenslandica STW-2017 TaxID=1969321 RepID=A0A1U9XPE4_9BIVA|nr:NADH dehydrogenase subunit 5 [Euciroa cf. queenslandica STW-2017]AQZ26118.1 NADH dehydrogenase subunit 5 [Euciroa cf. queenslandica STW-2017]
MKLSPPMYKFWLFMMMFLIMGQLCLLMGAVSPVIFEWEITQLVSCNFVFPLLFDTYSVVFLTVVIIISSWVSFYSNTYMSGEIFISRFIWLVFFFVLSMSLLIMVPSAWAVMLGWDGLGLTSFLLVIYYQNKSSLSAGMITALTNRLGDIFLLINFSLLSGGGQWGFYYITAGCYGLALCISVAAITKSAQLPFSSWLPAAMAAPTPVSALVHSSTLVTAGVFLLFRLVHIIESSELLKYFLMYSSMCTLVMAGGCAVVENDIKKVVALSTLSQLSMMVFSLSLGLSDLAFFHMVVHALFKALLFMCVGIFIYMNGGKQDMRSIGVMWSQAPSVVACFSVSNFALCGLPFMGAFYSKDLIIESMYTFNLGVLPMMMIYIGTGLTLVYTLRLYFAMWGSTEGTPLTGMRCENTYFGGAEFAMVMSVLFCPFVVQLCVSLEENVFVNYYEKNMMWMVLITSFLFIVLVKKRELVLPYKLYHYISGMWFFQKISAQPLSSQVLNTSGKLLMSLDHGWNEIIGGRGAYKLFKMMMIMNQEFQWNLMTTKILSGLMFISCFLVWFLWFV